MSNVSHKDFTVNSEGLDAKFQHEEPLLYKALYPHRILPPPNYLNPKHYATSAVASYRLWQRPDMRLVPHTTGCLMSLMLSKYSVPTYFVEPEFAEAVANTEPPPDFLMQHIRWPLPAMLFVLPDAFVMRYFKYYSPFIAVAHVPGGEYPPDASPYPETEFDLRYASKVTVPEESIVIHFQLFTTEDMPLDYTGNFKITERLSVVSECNFVNAVPYEEFMYTKGVNALNFSKGSPSTQAEEKQFKDTVFAFAVKLLLAMTARPEYIERGGLARPEKKKGNHVQEALYYPNVIGNKFRVLRPAAPKGEATGRKMPLYWHPGFWTYQPHGPRKDFISLNELPRSEGRIDWNSIPKETLDRFWACHEFKWISSYLVNAPKDSKD